MGKSKENSLGVAEYGGEPEKLLIELGEQSLKDKGG